jgi:hypothetical protein
MKKGVKNIATALFLISLIVGMTGSKTVSAATTPDLGLATSFGILSSTYVNTIPGTTITGDLGYTTLPAVDPTVNGSTYVAPSATYTQAGIDQGVALTALAAQPCTFNFAPGAIDLATDTTHGPIGVYTHGVYCITGAASIGTAGITLSGPGTYIFRMDGALTTVANSAVRIANGASECNVFWTPTEATTLGANSTFIGTDIDDAGITIGSTVTWTGRALSQAETVSTDADTISVPVCLRSTTATLYVIKTVVNTGGGTAVSSDFDLRVTHSGVDVTGSPAVGVVAPGTAYVLTPREYQVSETLEDHYAQTFSGDCDASGVVTLAAGDQKTCTVTNTYSLTLERTGVSPVVGLLIGGVVLVGGFVTLRLLPVIRKKEVA